MMRMRTGAWAAMAATVGVGILASGAAHASLARNAAGAKHIGKPGALTADTGGQSRTIRS